jgi:Zn-dependent oligopeptidase
MSLLQELNHSYITLHEAKETAFWSAKMGLKNNVPGEFEEKEIRLKGFISDATLLPKIRQELQREDLSAEERTGLEGWLRFFEVNTIESSEAIELQKKIIEMEGELERVRRDMRLGYTDPNTGQWNSASSVGLALVMTASKDEAVRRAAWQGLRSIEPFVLDHGFLDIVRERNRLARLLGYEDYYDYRVTVNEGFSKRKLFELLDELEEQTREACRQVVESLKEASGESAVAPWNFDFYTQGDLTLQTDPYHRFDDSVARWGESFAAMGIGFSGAQLTLDLVERDGKHDNGFMHGPFPAYIENGRFLPARINFTANAVPGKVGSGKRAMNTLMHEGGHAAHFSNIRMPAPCFSQEFAPTSVAFAETQSMFCDSLMNDADWLVRYAHNEAGQPMPLELIRQVLRQSHEYRSHQLRKMLAVPYAEKALYEMSDQDLTPENIVKMLRDVESRLLFQEGSGRPILSIPHLISGEASAYYHGYVLAQMAVFQTRDYFLATDGYIMDNPNIGRTLAEKYWAPGNSKTFLDMINDLTGEPFSAKATVRLVNKSLEDVYADADTSIAREREIPRHSGPIDLDAQITIVHGDQIISSTGGSSFEEMSERFAEWIRAQEERAMEESGAAGEN